MDWTAGTNVREVASDATPPAAAEGEAVVDPIVDADVDVLQARILALPRGPAVPWFLDVDGVLNLEDRMPDRSGDWPSYRRELVHTSKQLAVPFTWSPELVDCLNLLAHREQVEVRWLTSWDLDAPLCAAPAIGLEVGRRIAEQQVSDETLWWKLHVIKRVAKDLDFCVWTDDYIDEEIGTGVVHTMTGGKVFALSPDGRRGLTPRHLHLIIDAIAERRRSTEQVC